MGLRAQPFRENCLQRSWCRLHELQLSPTRLTPTPDWGYPTLLQISVSYNPLLQLNNL